MLADFPRLSPFLTLSAILANLKSCSFPSELYVPKNVPLFSNLNLIFKIIAKIMYNRIRSHLDKFTYQTRINQLSTETAMLKIHDDICMNIDSGKTTSLNLLDLSAAFGTLDHSSIIALMSGWYGISGTALNWIRSYLYGRVLRVKLLDQLVEPFKTDYGVPQSSVLGPLLSTLYTTPQLSRVFSRHITSATTSPRQTLRCHCRWSSSAYKTYLTG